ncbi:MAG: polyphosphate glucokinase [Myxococcales bacterium]|nr:polyphosphate glucokinase [Myxococcales bacterium]
MNALGIDIGGTGIKGAVVDTTTGRVITDRYRLLTPKPATAMAVIETVRAIQTHFSWSGPIGIGLPSVIQRGVPKTAAHISDEWIGLNAEDRFSDGLATSVTLLNDADAAGLAELRFGAGRQRSGTVLMVTLGTGIGSALLIDGQLVPNTEFGHLKMGDFEAEDYAADSIRKKQALDWPVWAGRLNEVLEAYEALLWPDLIILGGGGSKKYNKYQHLLKTKAAIAVAEFGNMAGIIGAAIAAAQSVSEN